DPTLRSGQPRTTRLAVSAGVPHIVCPVDQITDTLLRSHEQLRRTGCLSRRTLHRLGQLASGVIPSTPYDALKARIMCIEGHTGRGEIADAMRLLRGLQSNALFGMWAQRRIGEINEQGE